MVDVLADQPDPPAVAPVRGPYVGGLLRRRHHAVPFALSAIRLCRYFRPLAVPVVLANSRPARARVLFKIVNSLLLVPAGLRLLLMCFSEVACVKRAPPSVSPDGKHIAYLRVVLGGALSDDYGSISVRRTWWPFAQVVYRGPVGWNFQQHRVVCPKLTWLNNSTLLVANSCGVGKCASNTGEVTAICEDRSPLPPPVRK